MFKRTLLLAIFSLVFLEILARILPVANGYFLANVDIYVLPDCWNKGRVSCWSRRNVRDDGAQIPPYLRRCQERNREEGLKHRLQQHPPHGVLLRHR